MADNKPGNGYTTPFGNGNGATSAAGPSSGAHDFTKDAQGSGAPGKGLDVTKENYTQDKGCAQPDDASAAKTLNVYDDMDKSGPGIDGLSAPMPFKNLKG